MDSVSLPPMMEGTSSLAITQDSFLILSVSPSHKKEKGIKNCLQRLAIDFHSIPSFLPSFLRSSSPNAIAMVLATTPSPSHTPLSSFQCLSPNPVWRRRKSSRSPASKPLTGLQLRVSTWDDWRSSSRILSRIVHSYCCTQPQRQLYAPLVVKSEMDDQYEDSFSDVDKHLLDYFTYKAVRTVLMQLYEMNPTQYSWFYNFVVENKPQDSKHFLTTLVKERQELCERVMVTRLHLYNKWIKKYDHAKMYQAISDQNLELLRARLVQTVKWPSDGDDKKDL